MGVCKTRAGLRKDFFLCSEQKSVNIIEKQLYDCTQMIEIAKSLCSLLDFPVLIESILLMSMCQMRVHGAAMYIHKTFDSEFLVLEADYTTLNIEPAAVYAIAAADPLILYLSEKNRPQTVKDIPGRFKKGSAWKQIASFSPR